MTLNSPDILGRSLLGGVNYAALTVYFINDWKWLTCVIQITRAFKVEMAMSEIPLSFEFKRRQ
jgi:hypothetical protein